MLLLPAKNTQKSPVCKREIRVHKLWTKVYSQNGLTAMQCHSKRWVCYLQNQGHSEDLYLIKIWLFQLYTVWTRNLLQSLSQFQCDGMYTIISQSVLPNRQKCWQSFCFKFLSCQKTELLCSWSRSQQRFRTSLNCCQSYVFCTTDLFATKLGVLMFFSR